MQLDLIPTVKDSRTIIRDNAKRYEDVVKIELSKIVIRDNFNVREDYGDIESLASSILENKQAVPGRVDLLSDGTFVLTDGHRRFKALQLLTDKGHDAKYFMAIINGSKTTEEQRILQMFTTQDNKPLQPHEVAELINRLINLGHTQATVAKKIGKTAGYISQMLNFAHESQAIKEEVKKGNLTVSAALKLQKDIPVQSDRIEAVKQAVINKKEGSKTITVTQVTGKSHKDLKDEKFNEVANTLITLFNLEEDEGALSTIVTLLGNYF